MASGVALGVLGIGVVLAGCDTGDGKTLRNTVVPTTLPPPDTAPLESVELESGEVGSILPGAEATDPVVVPTDPATGPMELIAPWLDGAPIDRIHTCDADDVSPALSWLSAPDEAVEMALGVVDISTVDDDGEPFVHWVIAGFDPATISLIEGEVPLGAIQATNSSDTVGWSGPCPPEGDGPHEYRFTLYALAQQIEFGDGVPADEILPYLSDIALATAEVTGTYER